MVLSFLLSSSCATILPTASPMIERYSSNGFTCFGGTRMGGWRRYSLISLSDIHHSMHGVHSFSKA